MFARVRSATAASIAILFAITGIAACGGSDDDSAAAADTVTSAPTTVATGWQDDVEAYCDKLVAGLGSVPEPEPTPEGLATFIGALQASVADLPGLDTITVPADMQEDWDRIVEVAAGSGASLDAAAQASAAGDAGAAQTSAQ